MGIDCARELIEVAPLLAEFRRFMRRVQQIATLPLDIDEVGQPTIAARDEILSFFARRLVSHAT